VIPRGRDLTLNGDPRVGKLTFKNLKMSNSPGFAPGWGGEGQPQKFDCVKVYPGRDFDIHNRPLAGWKN